MTTTHHIVISLAREFIAPSVEAQHYLKTVGQEAYGHSSTSWGLLDSDELLAAIDADIDEALMRFGHQSVAIEVQGLQGIGEHIARRFGLDDSARVVMDDYGRPNLIFGAQWSLVYEGSSLHISRT